MERAAGIEPASLAWKAKVLPLHNARAARATYADGALSSRRYAGCGRSGRKSLAGNFVRHAAKLSPVQVQSRLVHVPVH